MNLANGNGQKRKNSKMKTNQETLRRMVRMFYDLQKMRIAFGNRTENPNDYILEKKADEDAPKRKKKSTKTEQLAALDTIFNRLAKDANVEVALAVEQESREITNPAPPVLNDEDREFFMSQNRLLEMLEQDALKRIEDVIKVSPVWKEFLEGVVGCGPTMAAVLFSEVRMAEPVDPEEIRAENVIELREIPLKDMHGDVWKSYVAQVRLRTRKKGEEGQVTDQIVVKTRHYFEKDGVLYRDFCPTVSSLWSFTGFAVNTTTGKAVRRERGTRINYNPFVKTKMFVLAGCFVKCAATSKKPHKYEQQYRNLKNRYDSSDWGKNKAHRDAAAKRGMMKLFLQDLWVKWRTLEGFPVVPPYSEAVLGRHHGDHGGVR